MIKKIKLIILFSFVLIFLFYFVFAFAQERELEVKYPEIGGLKPKTVKEGLPDYVRYIFTFGVVLIGLVVFTALIWGGIIYLTSAGNPVKLKEGKDRVISAFLGAIILLSSYIILTTINPQLVLFDLPPLTKIEKKEIPPPSEIKGEEVSLILAELPVGQSVEEGLWGKTKRNELTALLNENETTIEAPIEIKEKKFDINPISNSNKYLESLSKECHCELLTAICTEEKACGKSLSEKAEGCTGDPCPEDIRERINLVLGSNRLKIRQILDFEKKIIEKKELFEKELAKYNEIEQELLSCQATGRTVYTLNEYLSQLNFFREQGWTLKRITLPGAPSPEADFLTFYCSVGGTLFDYPYISELEIPPELLGAGLLQITETPTEFAALRKMHCSAEIPVGEIVDTLSELMVVLVSEIERLINLEGGSTEKLIYLNDDDLKFEGGLAYQLNKMEEYISQCTDKNCKTNCGCVPNTPCGLVECSVPAGQVLCQIPCFPSPWGCTPNPCYGQCTPCLQVVGGCEARDPNYAPCPRIEIETTVKKIKKLEKEALKTIREIRGIIDQVASLLGETPGETLTLKNVRDAVKYCYSSNIEEPSLGLLDCQNAIGNYGSDGLIIGSCNPRNFFCCSPSTEGLTIPFRPLPPREAVFIVPSEEYQPLSSIEGCPEGWLCDPDVKKYNQYQDASESLKSLLSCMRQRLDNIQKEKELKTIIGRISSISDSKLYLGTCDWVRGPVSPGGCSHTYEIKYSKERVSAHYGGPICRYQQESLALDLGDEQNADYIIEAAKTCRPDAFIYNEHTHLHISIGQAEECGSN